MVLVFLLYKMGEKCLPFQYARISARSRRDVGVTLVCKLRMEGSL